MDLIQYLYLISRGSVNTPYRELKFRHFSRSVKLQKKTGAVRIIHSYNALSEKLAT